MSSIRAEQYWGKPYFMLSIAVLPDEPIEVATKVARNLKNNRITVKWTSAGNFSHFVLRGRWIWLYLPVFQNFASVAQLGEQRFCKPQVVGSNPSAGFQYRSKVFLINDLGGIPKRSNGTDCKSVGYAFAGSNPAPPTWSKKEKRVAKRLNGNGRFRIFKGGFQKQVFLCGDSYWSIGMVYVVSPSSQIFMKECKNLVGCPLGFFRNLLH